MIAYSHYVYAFPDYFTQAMMSIYAEYLMLVDKLS